MVALGSLYVINSHADTLPPIEKTALFTKIARDCQTIELNQWNHPIRSILGKYKIKIEQVQLCNSNKYPIFFVDLPYDPMGPNENFYNPLFDKVRTANGKWPYSFVDTNDNTIINISNHTDGHSNIEFERYHP
jgi:hypothetical protein